MGLGQSRVVKAVPDVSGQSNIICVKYVFRSYINLNLKISNNSNKLQMLCTIRQNRKTMVFRVSSLLPCWSAFKCNSAYCNFDLPCCTRDPRVWFVGDPILNWLIKAKPGNGLPSYNLLAKLSRIVFSY